jgi:hypothetical protein
LNSSNHGQNIRYNSPYISTEIRFVEDGLHFIALGAAGTLTRTCMSDIWSGIQEIDSLSVEHKVRAMQYRNESDTPSHSNNMASPTCNPLPRRVLVQVALLRSIRKGLISVDYCASVRYDTYVYLQLGEVVGVRVRVRSLRRGSAVLALNPRSSACLTFLDAASYFR